MRKLIIAFALALMALVTMTEPGCKPKTESNKITYVTTIHPIAEIIKSVVGDRASVVQLLRPGASAHTYEPTPSDAIAAENAAAVIYVGKDMDDWAAGLHAKKYIALIDMVPASDRMVMVPHVEFEEVPPTGPVEVEQGVTDPHFWTDPLEVKAILPKLVEALSDVDPGGAATYKANAEKFGRELDALNDELAKILEPVKGRPVLLFHPSLQYMLRRYGLEMIGAIEASPGKETSVREITDVLAKRVKEKGARAVFSEPQLPKAPAEAVAKLCGVKIYEVDPEGGGPGRESYADLMRYNARTLAEALK